MRIDGQTPQVGPARRPRPPRHIGLARFAIGLALFAVEAHAVSDTHCPV